MPNIEDLQVTVKLNYDCLDIEDIGLISGLLKSEYEKTHSDIVNKRILKAQEHFKEAINCDVDIPKPVKATVKTFPEFYLNKGRFIYQRFESSEDKILIVLKDTNIENCKEVGIQLVDLLNNGTIKIEEI